MSVCVGMHVRPLTTDPVIPAPQSCLMVTALCDLTVSGIGRAFDTIFEQCAFNIIDDGEHTASSLVVKYILFNVFRQ